jgi:hypothetical protein
MFRTDVKQSTLLGVCRYVQYIRMMCFINVMQLAYELEESMTIIHFKIPKVNCTEVMLVLM